MNSENPELSIYGDKSKFELFIITGHSNGEVIMWYDIHSTFKKKILIDFKKSVEKIIHLENKYLLILTNDSVFYVWDLCLNDYVKEIELTLLPIRLQSMQLKDVCKGEDTLVYFSTVGGDLVQLDISYRKKWFNNMFVNEIKVQKFDNIVKLKNNYNCLTLLERENEKMIFLGGDDAQIFGFSVKNHELIDKWSIGDSVSCMDCVSTEDGGIAFAFGTKKGMILLRFDWEEFPKNFTCGKEIIAIKFTPNASHIIALSVNQYIYVFAYHNGSFFEFPPKGAPNRKRNTSFN